MAIWIPAGISFLLLLVLTVLNFVIYGKIRRISGNNLDDFERSIEKIEKSVSDQISRNRMESSEAARLNREEVSRTLMGFNEMLVKNIGEISNSQKNQFDIFSTNFVNTVNGIEQRLARMQELLDLKLGQIQADNTRKLEEMRKTVDEKLHSTLEKRLGESFGLVSERLELVHKGLGEMRNLASGVGDLKKVLTNVKTRGTWGEIQLGNLLEQILAPEQFMQNVMMREHSGEVVEYAIRLPGRDSGGGEAVWLPIDAKFPQENYLSLVDASENGDVAGIDRSVKMLESTIRKCAKDICDKYINPPKTTDFAIMFLPVEGLYAEVVRRNSLTEQIQRENRVIIAGPSTLAALLNSLQMGFKTLAIEKRSSEVWNMLGAVKTEFGRFGEVIDKVKRKIQSAGDEIERATTRTRAIEKKLRDVEKLPEADSAILLEIESAE